MGLSAESFANASTSPACNWFAQRTSRCSQQCFSLKLVAICYENVCRRSRSVPKSAPKSVFGTHGAPESKKHPLGHFPARAPCKWRPGSQCSSIPVLWYILHVHFQHEKGLGGKYGEARARVFEEVAVCEALRPSHSCPQRPLVCIVCCTSASCKTDVICSRLRRLSDCSCCYEACCCCCCVLARSLMAWKCHTWA